MLYQLSYASSLGQLPLRAQTAPSDPCVMSGTIFKVTITAIYVQAALDSFPPFGHGGRFSLSRCCYDGRSLAAFGTLIVGSPARPHFMRIRRRLPILLAVLLVAAAVAAVVELRKHAPPEPARLLPGADGFVYIDLKWLRWADVAKHLPAVPHDPEYEQFIQATGFQFERDLQEAALAVHYASPATGGETRFSEIFVGKIDGDRVRAYLKSLASSMDNYRSIDIYNIPLENRTLRVAILGVDTVAVSNHDDPAVIRGIVDRSRKLASPFGGPALLRQFYKHVPLTSLAWAIFRVEPQPGGTVVAG